MKYLRLRNGALALASAAILSVGARPAQAATLGELSVTAYGAKADGVTDNTRAFQSALNAAASSGAIVRVPAGQYFFSGTLTVPAQVILTGVNAGERSYVGYVDIGNNGGVDSQDVTANAGSVFLVTSGAGSAAGTPFLTLNANSGVRNATFYYPDQKDPTGPVNKPNPTDWVPTAYPFTISMTGRSGSVENVTGINPYQFIMAASSDGQSQCENIRRVNGTPLLTGVLIDNDGDGSGGSTDCLEDIHFIPGWGNGTGLNWVLAHATAFQINHADEIILRSCYCFFYFSAYHFGHSASGSASGTIINCGSDTCGTGVQVDNVQSTLGGLVFEGGAYSATGAGFSVNLASGNKGNVTFNAARFWGPATGLVNNASQKGSVTTFYACDFLDWGDGTLNPAQVCITCGDRNNPSRPSGKTRVVYCHFKRDQYTYTYTPGAAGVLFEGNSLAHGVHARIAGPILPSATSPHYIQANNF